MCRGGIVKITPSHKLAVILGSVTTSSGGVSNWTSGFLPSTYEGVLFRGQGEPVLNLNNPPGVTATIDLSATDVLNATIDECAEYDLVLVSAAEAQDNLEAGLSQSGIFRYPAENQIGIGNRHYIWYCFKVGNIF